MSDTLSISSKLGMAAGDSAVENLRVPPHSVEAEQSVLGGLLIGLIEVFWSAYFSVQYKDVAAFSILVVALVFMPTGLLGRADVEPGEVGHRERTHGHSPLLQDAVDLLRQGPLVDEVAGL